MSQGGEKQMGKGSSGELYKPLEHPQMEQQTTGLELFLAQAGHRHPTLAGGYFLEMKLEAQETEENKLKK